MTRKAFSAVGRLENFLVVATALQQHSASLALVAEVVRHRLHLIGEFAGSVDWERNSGAVEA